MNTDSLRLVLAGGMIGLLVLSAAAWRAVRGPTAPAAAAVSQSPGEKNGTVLASRAKRGDPGSEEQTEAAFGETAVPVFAEDEPAAGPYTVALRVTEAVRGEKLFVCDGTGCPLEEIVPDRDGDQTLGPLAPGRYLVCRGKTEIGAFRLYDNAALGEAEGRLWTDGELLCVERFVPGTAKLLLTLQAPGYYSFRLCDRVGQSWNRDLFIPESERPGRGRSYARTLEFRGLPPGAYTLVYRNTPIGQISVTAEETAELEVRIEN